MAAPTKPKPVLETYHSVKEAAVRLGLATEDADDKRGQRWLRDGVNHHGFPHHRMAQQLKFSDSDLAEIAERHRSRVHGNTGKRRARRATPTRVPRHRTAPLAA